MSGICKARKKRPQNRRKGRAGPPDPQMPHERFLPLIERVNVLIKYHEQKWPDGVNPQSFLKRHVDPTVRWYNSGDRSPAMLKKVEAMLLLLEVD